MRIAGKRPETYFCAGKMQRFCRMKKLILFFIAGFILYPGVFLLIFGTFLGAVWANISWGSYWAWDPKETWAAITWLSYLIYVHYRQLPRHRERLALWTLVISFALLQMCWWGINYLPSAQGSSVHTYN